MHETVTGLFLIGVPILFNVGFGLLASKFDYPDILREPTADVLTKFREGGSGLLMAWWVFALSAILFTPLAVLLAITLGEGDVTLLYVAMFVGVLASAVQFLGLIRWPFLVPYLARESAAAEPGSARAESIDIVFQSFNRYLGVAVGEHLGYFFTGAWTILIGIACTQSSTTPDWLGIIGILIGPFFILCSFEFLGSFEEKGWKLAGQIVPVVYIVWSIWLIGLGINFLA